MTIFGNPPSSCPCCHRVRHASLFLYTPSSFLTLFRVPFIPSTSLPISDPHIPFIFSFVPSCIKACRYYLKYNSVFPLSSTNHSSVLKSLPCHHQPLSRRTHRNTRLHDRHYHLAIPIVVRDYHRTPKSHRRTVHYHRSSSRFFVAPIVITRHPHRRPYALDLSTLRRSIEPTRITISRHS